VRGDAWYSHDIDRISALEGDAATVRALRKRRKDFQIVDGGGLFLLVTPNGSKLWRLKYRFRTALRSRAVCSHQDPLHSVLAPRVTFLLF
jgi:hypothetical protein